MIYVISTLLLGITGAVSEKDRNYDRFSEDLKVGFFKGNIRHAEQAILTVYSYT